MSKAPVAFIGIDYEYRNQIKLFVGERSKTAFDSGCKMFDLIIHDPNQFDTITFHNFYTAYLTIKADCYYCYYKRYTLLLD